MLQARPPHACSSINHCARPSTARPPSYAAPQRLSLSQPWPSQFPCCSSGMSSSSSSSSTGERPFDTESFDRERLQLDQQARDAMVALAAAQGAVEASAPGSQQGAWKWALRKKMWDYMEQHNIARPPRPVHHRIPNFVDAEAAAARLAQLPEFQSAATIKVNPDTPQKMVRWQVLSAGKALITPQPRLRTGFFSLLTAADLPGGDLLEACTSAGAARWGRPLGLGERLRVDAIVVGSSCVSRNGARLGKGEGFAELEYGILRWMGAIDDTTPVITTIHDCQLLEQDIPPGRMLEHDVPVDIIVTPTQVIRTGAAAAGLVKPGGILWHRLSPQKLGQIRVLQQLKERIEQETGQQLPSGPDEVLPPLAQRSGRRGGRGGRGGRGHQQQQQQRGRGTARSAGARQGGRGNSSVAASRGTASASGSQ